MPRRAWGPGTSPPVLQSTFTLVRGFASGLEPTGCAQWALSSACSLESHQPPLSCNGCNFSRRGWTSQGLQPGLWPPNVPFSLQANYGPAALCQAPSQTHEASWSSRRHRFLRQRDTQTSHYSHDAVKTSSRIEVPKKRQKPPFCLGRWLGEGEGEGTAPGK